VSHREYVRNVLRAEAGLTAVGPNFVPMSEVSDDAASPRQRRQLNSEGSPSELVASGYIWAPGTELSRLAPIPGNGAGESQRTF